MAHSSLQSRPRLVLKGSATHARASPAHSSLPPHKRTWQVPDRTTPQPSHSCAPSVSCGPSTTRSPRHVLARAHAAESWDEDDYFTEPEEHPAVTAFKQDSLGFGFSAGGLLFPYYIGVVDALSNMGILKPGMPIAGSSAGSLIAALFNSGMPADFILEACGALAEDCRRGGTRGRLKSVLADVLETQLPHDAHVRCWENTFVAVTQAWPQRGQLICDFESREDLIGALLTSCHIPWYFEGTLTTKFRGDLCYDGGVANFIPTPPNVSHAVQVTCFPARNLLRVPRYQNVQIAPDLFGKCPWPADKMISWAFVPPPHEDLTILANRGRKDAMVWASSTGLLEAAIKRSEDDGTDQVPPYLSSTLWLPTGYADRDS